MEHQGNTENTKQSLGIIRKHQEPQRNHCQEYFDVKLSGKNYAKNASGALTELKGILYTT